jgi:hypothetical protein
LQAQFLTPKRHNILDIRHWLSFTQALRPEEPRSLPSRELVHAKRKSLNARVQLRHSSKPPGHERKAKCACTDCQDVGTGRAWTLLILHQKQSACSARQAPRLCLRAFKPHSRFGKGRIGAANTPRRRRCPCSRYTDRIGMSQPRDEILSLHLAAIFRGKTSNLMGASQL